MSAVPESLVRGERGVNARRFAALGLGVVAVVVWTMVFAGAFGMHRDHVAIGLQLTASGVAAVALTVAARRPDPPMGTATGLLGLGSALWFVTGAAWLVVTEFDLAAPEWLNLGYAAGTAVSAAAVWSASRSDGSGASIVPVTRTVAVIDSLLIAGGIGVWWLYTVWEPLVGSTQTAITLVLTLVDAAFLAGALLHWSRAAAPRRANSALVLLAAVVLTGTDVLYARDLLGYAAGDAVDVGWYLGSGLLAGAAFQPRWSAAIMRSGTSDVSRWVQALLAPALVVVVLASIAVQPQPPAADGHVALDAAVWFLMGGLILRQIVQLSEHVLLNRRLEASTEVLRHQAEHDDLTGLLDRHAFHDRVDVLLADRAVGQPMTVLWVHLDSIGQVDDLLGTTVGDRVLSLVADRLRSACDATDLIARYEHGDFVALRPGLDGRAEAWAEDVRTALADVFEVDGVRIRVTTAVGLFDVEDTDDGSSALLSEVSVAMAEIKRQGRNRVTRRTLDADRVDRDRGRLAQDLRTAIDEHRLRVHYQPICDLRSGHVLGAEALLRFEHPTRGDIGPSEFLPVAEATGLMPELAMLVLNEACSTFADDPGLGWVTVNLSESDLADPRLLDWVQATLDRTGLDPGRLMIELTERVVPEADVIRGIDRLRELGIGLALDDFGSAWTSLAQVQKLSIRLVKLDRSIIERLDAPEGERFRALLRAVVTLADLLGVVVLAEGIETERQLEECRAAGVRLGQGFLWAPALPVTAMVRYVATAPSAMLDPDYDNPLVR